MTVLSMRQTWYSRLISLCLMVTFVVSMVITPKASYAGVVGLPAPGTMVNLSPSYVPLMITGLTVHPDNPLLMDFIVSTGNSGMNAAQVKKESDRLIKYFLACLTIPENNQWVNLSPYEKNRIIPEDLGQTVLGRDMLAQDYLLKQLTASLIYPEKNLGKNFWDKIYAKANEMYGTTQIPVNTFNKVWILPDTAKVYEHKDTVFVVKSHLRVMLDEDYLALSKHPSLRGAEGDAAISQRTAVNNLGSNIVRQIVLPAIEQEVNTGKNFSQLRQIYNSMLLAVWFKNNLKQALLNQVYTDKSKVNGVNVDDPAIKEKIYKQYLEAYKKGVFNYIKEDTVISRSSQGDEAISTVPRKYFSGGEAPWDNSMIHLATAEEARNAAMSAPVNNNEFEIKGECALPYIANGSEILQSNLEKAISRNSSAISITVRYGDLKFEAKGTSDAKGIVEAIEGYNHQKPLSNISLATGGFEGRVVITLRDRAMTAQLASDDEESIRDIVQRKLDEVNRQISPDRQLGYQLRTVAQYEWILALSFDRSKTAYDDDLGLIETMQDVVTGALSQGLKEFVLTKGMWNISAHGDANRAEAEVIIFNPAMTAAKSITEQGESYDLDQLKRVLKGDGLISMPDRPLRVFYEGLPLRLNDTVSADVIKQIIDALKGKGIRLFRREVFRNPDNTSLLISPASKAMTTITVPQKLLAGIIKNAPGTSGVRGKMAVNIETGEIFMDEGDFNIHELGLWARSFAEVFEEEGLTGPEIDKSFAVVYDGRPKSEEFMDYFARVLRAYGSKVKKGKSEATTPTGHRISAAKDIVATITGTASHNPLDQNGFKFSMNGVVAPDSIFFKVYKKVVQYASEPQGSSYLIDESGTPFEQIDPVKDTEELYRKDFNGLGKRFIGYLLSLPEAITTSFDFMHGTGGVYGKVVEEILSMTDEDKRVLAIELASDLRATTGHILDRINSLQSKIRVIKERTLLLKEKWNDPVFRAKRYLEGKVEVPYRPEPKRIFVEDVPEFQDFVKNAPIGSLYLGIDGDADRLAIWVKTEKGVFKVTTDGVTELAPNYLGFLLGKAQIDELAAKGIKKIVVAKTLPTSYLTESLVAYARKKYDMDATLVETPVGSKYFGSYFREGVLAIGVEESGHIVLPKYFDDAIAEALTLLQLLSQKENYGKTLMKIINDSLDEVGTYVGKDLKSIVNDRVNVPLTPSANAFFNETLAVGNVEPIKEAVTRAVEELNATGQYGWELEGIYLTTENENKVVKSLEINEYLGQKREGVAEPIKKNEGFKVKFKNGAWTMIRISGTEGVIRIYAEGFSKREYDGLNQLIEKVVPLGDFAMGTKEGQGLSYFDDEDTITTINNAAMAVWQTNIAEDRTVHFGEFKLFPRPSRREGLTVSIVGHQVQEYRIEVAPESGDLLVYTPQGDRVNPSLGVIPVLVPGGTFEVSEDHRTSRIKIANKSSDPLVVDFAVLAKANEVNAAMSTNLSPLSRNGLIEFLLVPVGFIVISLVAASQWNDFKQDLQILYQYRVNKAIFQDRAKPPGGIDLNSRNLKMQSEGEKVNISFDPAMIAQFRRGDFSGVRIRILDVVPVNIMPLLGLKEDEESGQLAKA